MKISFPISRALFIFFIISLILYSNQLFAAEKKTPELADIVVTTSAEDLLLFVTVKDGFNHKMIEGVKNGLPVSFIFHLELERIRTWWFDESLISYEITQTLTYDALRKEYEISLSGRENEIIKTRSLIEAKGLMSRLDGYPVVRRSLLIPDAPYTLRVKVTLEEVRLPLSMHYVIPFSSLWNFETDWQVIQFHY
jgi:hypothetical protein